ncbi:helix-turn-helix domain-containing protein [Lysobacter sp. Root494]|uniref:MerR family transcriptional regulator n=1 Tax=Lysobacter sp. Root494 TaxID=1736549 RepID=UPI0006F58CD4|nr:helix-turn-helix domain-containing protein [Lysobacter sp. Root494]KQY51186.1 MerR family transcriptional regulator [Lysobacter sp. Root494]
MTSEIKIGQLAKVTHTTPPTIRYYEDIGLLQPPPRQAGSQRVYGDGDVRRLTFIRRCREFGFSIDRVRVLASLVQDRERSCMEARELAFSHLVEVREKLQELQELEHSIAAFVDSCDQSCAGGVGADCVMLEELSAPENTAASRATRSGCCAPVTADRKSR